jgi:hypothetical protein
MLTLPTISIAAAYSVPRAPLTYYETRFAIVGKEFLTGRA